MLREKSCTRAGVLSAVTLAIGLGTFSLAAQAGGEGWYTKSQARSGQGYFNTFCAQCHRPDLTGAMGPALKGKTFISKWKTGEELYSFASKNMPQTNPGSVDDKYMIPIIAFIMSENGLPGGAKLTKGTMNRPLK